MTFSPCLVSERTPLRKKIIAPRGPRRDLCVVVITMSESLNGEGITLAATRPETWANIRIKIGTNRVSDGFHARIVDQAGIS